MTFQRPLLALLTFALASPSGLLGQQTGSPAQNAIAVAELHIGGDVGTPLNLSPEELKKMRRKTLKVLNPHEKKTEVYEGVPLEELLRRAGVPQGSNMRGAAMASYVVAEAIDG